MQVEHEFPDSNHSRYIQRPYRLYNPEAKRFASPRRESDRTGPCSPKPSQRCFSPNDHYGQRGHEFSSSSSDVAEFQPMKSPQPQQDRSPDNARYCNWSPDRIARPSPSRSKEPRTSTDQDHGRTYHTVQHPLGRSLDNNVRAYCRAQSTPFPEERKERHHGEHLIRRTSGGGSNVGYITQSDYSFPKQNENRDSDRQNPRAFQQSFRNSPGPNDDQSRNGPPEKHVDITLPSLSIGNPTTARSYQREVSGRYAPRRVYSQTSFAQNSNVHQRSRIAPRRQVSENDIARARASAEILNAARVYGQEAADNPLYQYHDSFQRNSNTEQRGQQSGTALRRQLSESDMARAGSRASTGTRNTFRGYKEDASELPTYAYPHSRFPPNSNTQQPGQPSQRALRRQMSENNIARAPIFGHRRRFTENPSSRFSLNSVSQKSSAPPVQRSGRTLRRQVSENDIARGAILRGAVAFQTTQYTQGRQVQENSSGASSAALSLALRQHTSDVSLSHTSGSNVLLEDRREIRNTGNIEFPEPAVNYTSFGRAESPGSLSGHHPPRPLQWKHSESSIHGNIGFAGLTRYPTTRRSSKVRDMSDRPSSQFYDESISKYQTHSISDGPDTPRRQEPNGSALVISGLGENENESVGSSSRSQENGSDQVICTTPLSRKPSLICPDHALRRQHSDSTLLMLRYPSPTQGLIRRHSDDELPPDETVPYEHLVPLPQTRRGFRGQSSMAPISEEPRALSWNEQRKERRNMREMPPTKSAKNKSAIRTKTVEVGPGRIAELRGAQETWDAILHGFVSVIECSECRQEFCFIEDAKYYSCPGCKCIGHAFRETKPHAFVYGVGLGLDTKLMRAMLKRKKIQQRRMNHRFAAAEINERIMI